MSAATQTRKPIIPRTPPMTAEEATAFSGVSNASIIQVVTALEFRKAQEIHPDCSCQPYEDVFTFHRWKALGQSVKKGEKSLRISSWVPRGGKRNGLPESLSEPERERIGEVKLRPQTLCLFCRCQVEPKD